MKKLCILAAISLLAIMATEGFCSSVLISVELPTIESKKAWHKLNIPTYELIGNTAIAETEESLTSSLKQKGYLIGIIDRQPDLSKYVIISNIERTPDLPGTFIWQKDKTTILKSMSKDAIKDVKYKHQSRPMNTRPLGDRFWTSATTKYVPLKSIPYDPFIQSLVDQVNADSIASYIQRLQDFKTRVALTDSSYVASAWIKQKFEQWGYIAEFDSFYIDTTYYGYKGYERNVIGTAPGTLYPDRDYIVCGHFDSAPLGNSDTIDNNPGADDNASGTAATMEAARIFKNYTWESTIKFIGWAAEECGLVGSMHYAQNADSMGKDIGGVVNMDMIGYMDDLNIDCDATASGSFSIWLSELYYSLAQLYVPDLIVLKGENSGGGSDQTSFSLVGYSALFCIETPGTAWNPNYHQAGDLLSTLSPELFIRVTKASIATIGVLGICPGPVKDVAVVDPGEGMKLVVNWTPNEESDVLGYWIYYGTQSEIYSDSIFINGVSSSIDTIGSLLPDTTYYLIIRAIDSDDHKSPYATEVTATPRIEPLTPSGFAASPVMNGVNLSWINNKEGDLVGYSVFRKVDDGGYDSLRSTFDTTYVDSPLSGANKYYYKIRAYDTDGNYSQLSDSVYSRPITLDQGILVVDETNNWVTGSYPRDAQQDSFYNYILSDYKHEQHEYGSSNQKPILADFGPYSTVAWFADDYTSLLASGAVENLKVYLDNGGKLWFTGWKATGDIRNDVGYAADFTSGSFIYDYLKISHVSLSAYTDSFQAVTGSLGYPPMSVDPIKVPISTWLGTMRYIENLTPVSTGEGIYSMDMKNDGSVFEGQVCAVRDSGKTVLFGFPLYFMDKEQVKAAAQKIMAEYGEPSGVAGKPDNREQITDFRLFPNAPNPFAKFTIISYQLPVTGQVGLKIYNIAGQLVKTLISQDQPAGSYAVKWDGRDDKSRQVSNGVYFYCLQSSSGNMTNRMVLIR